MQADVQAFKKREKPRGKAAHVELSQLQGTEVPSFLNGRALRDYQVDSLHWMISNLRQKRSCILGDEMVSPTSPSPMSSCRDLHDNQGTGIHSSLATRNWQPWT